jgi:uncharacterized protein YqjF (DUF2071 family)
VDTARNACDLLVSPLIQERSARVTKHRPWPVPRRSWLMAQSWIDLLFAHWSVPAEALRSVVPPQLPLDTFEGSAWIGVTPFEVRNLRLRPTPPVPVLSAFPEINVRTYVTIGGKPGIFFFSLDATSGLAVAAARRFYRLPYFQARMSIERSGDSVYYASERSPKEDAPRATFRASYRPRDIASPPVAGTLEHWLTERYCLYTLDDQQQVLRGEIHHPPWPLQPAEADIPLNSMGDEIGAELSGEPLLHFAARQDVVFWTLELVKRGASGQHVPST